MPTFDTAICRLCVYVSVKQTLVTKYEFWRNSYTVRVYFSGVRMKWKLFKSNLFSKTKQLWKTKLWFWWSARKSKPRADCAQGWEVNKNSVKTSQSDTFPCYCKSDVPVELCKSPTREIQYIQKCQQRTHRLWNWLPITCPTFFSLFVTSSSGNLRRCWGWGHG